MALSDTRLHESGREIYHNMIYVLTLKKVLKRSVKLSLTKEHYEALSEFRYQLRRFLQFSETAAKSAGLTPLQYLLLLHVRGFPGRDWASVGELAERLQIKQHGMVALLTRCEENDLVERRPSVTDRRQVEVHLLPLGEQLLQKLARLHEAELRSLQDTFTVKRITAFNNEESC